MFSNLKPFLITVLALIVALIVYNKFLSGMSLFGHFESSNYEVDENGNVMQAA